MMRQSLFERAMAAGASNDPQAMRDLHDPDFFCSLGNIVC